MRVAAVTVRQLSKDSKLYELALDLRSEQPPDSPDGSGGNLISCVNTTPSGTFYPLGGNLDVPNVSDGVVYYLNPGIIFPIEPDPGHQGHWHFPTYSSGGVGTIDYAGACTQSVLRLLVRGNGTMTVNMTEQNGLGNTFRVKLSHHQYQAGEEGNSLSGVDVLDATWLQQPVGVPFVIPISTHDGQNCTHWVDIQDDGGKCASGIGFVSMVWALDS